jgi:hypothetical protein
MIALTLLICLFLALFDWLVNRKYYSQDGSGLWQDTNNQLRSEYWQSKAQIKEYERLMLKANTLQNMLYFKMMTVTESFSMDIIRQLIGGNDGNDITHSRQIHVG